MTDTPDTLQRLGPYRILRELGAGAMGTVYLAHDDEEDRRIALKVLHPHLFRRKGFFKRFQREAWAGEQVCHPNVVRTYDCGLQMDGETPYCVLAMEYVEGQTLRALLAEIGRVPETLLREIALQITAGLAAIHEAGIVHRDLKPENVLITRDHEVRIMDLGVARLTQVSTVLTREGQFAGSLLYAAPEQFRAAEVGPAADLYSLGVTLYELATGANPFQRDEAASVMRAHLEDVLQRLDLRSDEISPFFASVVAALLQKNTTQRLSSAVRLQGVMTDGEASTWWADRERELLRLEARRPRVPVRRETKLYGRDEDHTRLLDAWQEASRGRGVPVLLEGEPGIGKSRLVDAFLATVDAESANILYGSHSPTGGASAISTSLLSHLGQGDLEESLRSLARETPTLVPALRAFLLRKAAPEGVEPLQGDALHTVLVHVMRGLATKAPVLWVLEDLHFADDESRRTAFSLARAVAGHPVLLLLTTRPGLPEASLADLRHVEELRRVHLGRLGARNVIELLRDAFRSERLAERLGGKIANKSDGVPFFIFEMIRGLKDGQFITELPDGSWIESKVIDEIEVPPAVKDLVEVRLRGLSGGERAILEMGAVLGYEFDPDLIARIECQSTISVLRALADLERRLGLVRAEGSRYRFDHHQLQEIVYENLHPRLRREYHLAIAEELEAREGAADGDPRELYGTLCVDLCEHFLKGASGEKAQRLLDAALTHLERTFLNDQAIALADRALTAPDLLRGEERLNVLLRKSGRLDLMGRAKDQEEVLEEARSLAVSTDDKASLAKVERAAGNLLMRVGRVGEAREHHERDLALSHEIGDRQGVAYATGNLGIVFQTLGRHEEAREHYERDRAHFRQVGDKASEAAATINLGTLLTAGDHYAEAQSLFKQGMQLAIDCGDRRWEAKAASGLGRVFTDLGRYAEAREYIECGRALAGEIGDRQGDAKAAFGLGTVCFHLGCLTEARKHYEHMLAVSREVGDRRGEAAATGNLGNLLMLLGRSADARERNEQFLHMARESGDRLGEAHALGNLGNIFRIVGRRVEAREHLDQSLALSRQIGTRYLEGVVLWTLASLTADEGDAGGAEHLVKEALALGREIGNGDSIAESLILWAEIRGRIGDLDAARTALEEAAVLSRQQQRKAQTALALAILAALTGGDVHLATAALEQAGEGGNTPEIRHLLWEATNDSIHLAEAKRLLDYRVEHAPEEYRESMRKNVRLNREIMEAWEEHGEPAVGEGDVD